MLLKYLFFILISFFTIVHVMSRVPARITEEQAAELYEEIKVDIEKYDTSADLTTIYTLKCDGIVPFGMMMMMMMMMMMT